MAGGKKTKQQIATLDSIADRVRHMTEHEGLSIRKVVARLTDEGISTNRAVVHGWLNNEANKAWYQACKKARATDCAEQSLEVLETATTEDISVKREQAKALQWMAGVLDPGEYGNRPQVAVQVNVADAFIQAMRERGNA